MTERTKCAFPVKEYGDGLTFIKIEEDEPMPTLGEAFLGLEFREKTSLEEARRISSYLHEKFKGIMLTNPMRN